MNVLDKAKNNFLNNEKYLSEYACLDKEAIRLREDDSDIRPNYFHDIDRIIHSLSYTRYLDKTQVFTRSDNDHISKRITHVQLVSKIARTIGRALSLNEDLIEAIALGHDIGHTPLGHTGEAILNEISLEELGEYFAHNIQSVRHLMIVENHGNGLNLTIQVLDGIMCHNGEMLDSKYVPMKKGTKEFLKEFNDSYKDLKKSNKNRPMTLEGCVVRISDIIGYITIIIDIITNSMDKPYIKMSDDVYKALINLKKFNYEHIYSKSMTKEDIDKYTKGMRKIYDRYLNDIGTDNKNSIIYHFLDDKSSDYLEKTSDKRKVIDFIAGMTDEMFIREISK